MRYSEKHRLSLMKIVARYGVDEEAAKRVVNAIDTAHMEGVIEGQEQAQRFYRLALGIEQPTHAERAAWNNPVPLNKFDSTE